MRSPATGVPSSLYIMVCMQPNVTSTQPTCHCQQLSYTTEGMSHPQGSCNAVSCPSHTEIQDHARAGIMISYLNKDFKFASASKNELKDCTITSSGIDDDAGSWNVEFKDGGDEYNSESSCSIDMDLQYLLGANDEEQEQGFILPSWQHDIIGNDSFSVGSEVGEFFSTETETAQLLELCMSDCWFGGGGGSIEASTHEDWFAESLSGDFLTDCCDHEMKIPS